MTARKPLPTVKVTLECGHHSQFGVSSVPELGSKAYCTPCDNWWDIIEIPDKWEAKCISRKGCYHTTSNSEAVALRRCDAHSSRTKHLMQVRHGGRTVHQWEPMEGWYQPWHPRVPGL